MIFVALLAALERPDLVPALVFGAGVFYILRLMSQPPHRGEEGPERDQPVRAAGLTPSPAVPESLTSPGGEN